MKSIRTISLDEGVGKMFTSLPESFQSLLKAYDLGPRDYVTGDLSTRGIIYSGVKRRLRDLEETNCNNLEVASRYLARKLRI